MEEGALVSWSTIYPELPESYWGKKKQEKGLWLAESRLGLIWQEQACQSASWFVLKVIHSRGLFSTMSMWYSKNAAGTLAQTVNK